MWHCARSSGINRSVLLPELLLLLQQQLLLLPHLLLLLLLLLLLVLVLLLPLLLLLVLLQCCSCVAAPTTHGCIGGGVKVAEAAAADVPLGQLQGREAGRCRCAAAVARRWWRRNKAAADATARITPLAARSGATGRHVLQRRRGQRRRGDEAHGPQLLRCNRCCTAGTAAAIYPTDSNAAASSSRIEATRPARKALRRCELGDETR